MALFKAFFVREKRPFDCVEDDSRHFESFFSEHSISLDGKKDSLTQIPRALTTQIRDSKHHSRESTSQKEFVNDRDWSSSLTRVSSFKDLGTVKS